MINPINTDFKSVIIDSVSVELLKQSYKDHYDLDVSDYFEGLEKVDICQCVITKYRFFYPFKVIGDANFYRDLSSSKINYYHSRWEHRLALLYAKPNSRWLEVGSGNSFFLNELTRVGVESIGLELNHLEIEKAKNNGLNVLENDFFSFENDGEKFDVICLFQVLEHMSDVSGFFEKARCLLKPNGKLIFSVPNSNPYLYYFDKFHTLNLPPHHMGLWDSDSIERVGKSFKFEVTELSVQKLDQFELEIIIKNALVEGDFLNRKLFKGLEYVLRILPNRISRRLKYYLCHYVFKGRNLFAVLERND